MADDIKKQGGAAVGEPLAKRSKNVREQTRNISPETAHQRILRYIRSQGVRTRQTNESPEFGVGENGPFIRYDSSIEPEHEMGHALMTPVGRDLNQQQNAVNERVGGPGAWTTEERNYDDLVATQIQHGIARRAGAAPRSSVIQTREDIRNPDSHFNTSSRLDDQYREGVKADMARAPQAQKEAQQILGAYDKGTRKMDIRTGRVMPGTSTHAKINERAMAKNENKLTPPQWLGRPILHDEHVQDLETRSAINEFHHKMPRGQAEQAAHEGYVKEQRERAAAHHLAGMKAAMATGNHEDARKHWALYDLHLKSLGKESIGAVPPEIEKRMLDEGGGKPVYRFKAHKGDLYALHEPSKDQAPAQGEPIQKAESKTCKWRLGERRCQRKVNDGYCHSHKDHWANKIKQKEAKEQPQELEKGDLIKLPPNPNPRQDLGQNAEEAGYLDAGGGWKNPPVGGGEGGFIPRGPKLPKKREPKPAPPPKEAINTTSALPRVNKLAGQTMHVQQPKRGVTVAELRNRAGKKLATVISHKGGPDSKYDDPSMYRKPGTPEHKVVEHMKAANTVVSTSTRAQAHNDNKNTK